MQQPETTTTKKTWEAPRVDVISVLETTQNNQSLAGDAGTNPKLCFCSIIGQTGQTNAKRQAAILCIAAFVAS